MIPAALLKKYGPPAAVVLLAAVLLLAVRCDGVRDGKRVEQLADANDNVALLEKKGGADAAAATDRAASGVKLEQQKQELRNAQDRDDPDAARIARGCVILRQQGRDTRDIPACR